MEIRPALPLDAPALTRLGARLFRATYQGQIPATEVDAYVAQAFRPEIQARESACPGGGVLIAVADADPVAYAQLRPTPCPCPCPFPDPLEVARFYLDAPWHGQGLAAELMAACRRQAAAQGRGGLWLQVWEENPRAKRFYHKQGFQDLGETTFQVGALVYHDRVMACEF